jgi:APA family basic amino acid/polyamine antiporter
MVSPGLAFTAIWTYALASFFGQIPLYALGCARYAQVFFPSLSSTALAIFVVTLFYIINVLGVKIAAQVQGALVLVLLSALVYYAVKGFGAIQPVNLTPVMGKGLSNLFLGTALLTFTYLGSNAIIELGGEIVDPARTIPRAFMIAFPVVAVIYIAVAVATVGAVPSETLTETAEPLIRATRLTMSSGGTLFFVFGGAILALTTTLNALFIVGTKSLLTIIGDHLLPSRLGRLHPRFKTPHILLTIIWLLSLLGIVSEFSLETLASFAALGGLIIFLPIQLAALRLPRLYPNRYDRAAFKLKGIWFWLCPVCGILMVCFFGAIILYELKSLFKIGSFFIFIITGVAYYLQRRAYLQRKGFEGRHHIVTERDWDG